MAKQEKYYSYAMIAIVAIVAIVGIVVMMLNVQPKLGISTSTEQESLLGSAAATTTCTDSDGGKNYNLQGTATKGTNIITDYCRSNKIVLEYYCVSNQINSITYDCTKAAKVCIEGKCVKPPICGNGIIETGEQCDSNNLKGKNCTSFNFTGGTLKCNSLCKFDTAHCIEGWCNDTDGGKNYYVKGYVYSTVGPQAPESGWDDCLDDNYQSNTVVDVNGNVIKPGNGTKVSETFCNEQKMYQSEIVDCPYGCYDGACIAEPVCGNGIIEVEEECEGEGKIDNCFNSYGLPSTKECSDCSWTNCDRYTGYCGDGQWVPQAEHCEGTNLGAMKSCTGLANFTGGTLACDSYCRYDTSKCTPVLMCSCTITSAVVDFTLSIPGTNESISDSLHMGETKSYTLGGKYYEATAVFFSRNHTTKLQVNGVLTSELSEGSNEGLGDGAIIRINEILIACTGSEGGSMVQFTLKSLITNKLVTGRLTDGRTLAYPLDGEYYNVTAVFISEDYTAKLSVNGMLTKKLEEGESDIMSEKVSVSVDNIMTSPGSSIVDFFVIRTDTGQVFNEKIAGGETKTYINLLGDGKDYEITALYINGPSNPSAILSVNGMLTDEIRPGETDLLSGGIDVGIYSVQTCTITT